MQIVINMVFSLLFFALKVLIKTVKIIIIASIKGIQQLCKGIKGGSNRNEISPETSPREEMNSLEQTQIIDRSAENKQIPLNIKLQDIKYTYEDKSTRTEHIR